MGKTMTRADPHSVSPPLPAPQVDRRVALTSILGFWLLYFILNTLRMGLENEPQQWALMKRRVVVVLVSMVATYVLYLTLRRVEGKSTRVLITTAFLASIPVSLAYAAFNFAVFYVIDPLESDRHELAELHGKHVGSAAIIADSMATWYFFFVAWAVLYVALSYAGKVRHAERSTAEYRAAAQAAQLRALRYQINPHFLFNTLNSLSTLVLRQRTDDAERMITSLATFFRTSLTDDPADDVALGDEVRLQRLYLDIEKIRFPDRLLVDCDVPAELEGARVPGLILQPLVENAIKYGIARTPRPVTVSIRARAENGSLCLTVDDDGDDASDAPPGHGVGLRNVSDRLTARFDGAAACRYGPNPAGGFRVELTMPLLNNV